MLSEYLSNDGVYNISDSLHPNLEYRFFLEQEDEWRSYLEENGFVVIKNHIPFEKIRFLRREMRDFMNVISPTGSYNGSNNSSIPDMLHGGMIQYVGHSEPQKKARKYLKKPFSVLLGSERLVHSYDGFCYMPENKKFTPKLVGNNLHVDQSFSLKEHDCYQGLLNLYDAASYGFVCCPGSHKRGSKKTSEQTGIGDDFYKRFGKEKLDSKRDWYRFSDDQKIWLEERGHTPGIVPLLAGDILFFDSRLMHSNITPTKPQTVPRVVIYVCYKELPEDEKDSFRILKKLDDARNNRICTSHHPFKFTKLTYPRYTTKERREFYEKIIEEL